VGEYHRQSMRNHPQAMYPSRGGSVNLGQKEKKDLSILKPRETGVDVRTRKPDASRSPYKSRPALSNFAKREVAFQPTTPKRPETGTKL